MDEVFKELIVEIMEVYVDDMVVKLVKTEDHPAHLERVFNKVRKHNMRFNSKKMFF